MVFGPGSWFTSVLPHLLVPELASALRGTQAHRLVALNLAPQPGETGGFSPHKHLEVLAGHSPGLEFDVVLADSSARGAGRRRGGGPGEGRRALGARLVLADVAVADGTPRHDPVLLVEGICGHLRRPSVLWPARRLRQTGPRPTASEPGLRPGERRCYGGVARTAGLRERSGGSAGGRGSPPGQHRRGLTMAMTGVVKDELSRVTRGQAVLPQGRGVRDAAVRGRAAPGRGAHRDRGGARHRGGRPPAAGRHRRGVRARVGAAGAGAERAAQGQPVRRPRAQGRRQPRPPDRPAGQLRAPGARPAAADRLRHDLRLRGRVAGRLPGPRLARPSRAGRWRWR